MALPAFALPLPLEAGQAAWRCPDPASLIDGLKGEMAHVRYLADDLLEGRAVATRGERCAGDYIAAEFRALGLRPAGGTEGYFQAWMVRTGSALGDGNEFVLDGDTPARFTAGDDWSPYGFSASTRAEARMTLVPALTGAQPGDSAHAELAFTGEERGLWGSAHYVESPLRPLEGTVAMLNLDMVGRVAGDLLTVFGTGTAEEWEDILERANRRTAAPLDLRFNSDGFGASDHNSFHARGIPVLHFFSNTHPEYHRVEDDWELVNADGMARVTELVAAVVREVVPAAGPASLTPVEGAGNPHGVQGPTDGSAVRSGFRVRLGTIPDYSRESGGMAITGVRDGGPAAKAGLKGGDIIVKFGPHDIEDVYGYMYALGEFDPGDRVEVVVLRGGRRMVFEVVLERGGDAPSGQSMLSDARATSSACRQRPSSAFACVRGPRWWT